ncbi:MAG: arylsulfotransferase family protein, partial [Planctomycetota bacterium]
MSLLRLPPTVVAAALLSAACSGGGDGSKASRADTAAPDPAKPRGQWYVAEDGPLTDAQAASARALEGLGYASGMEEMRAAVGVLRHDAARAMDGLNLYVSGHGAEALLVDMDGTLVHRWAHAPSEIWPDRAGLDFSFFRKARLLPDGGLLGIFEGKGLVRLDRDSNVVWSYAGPAHHDAQLLSDGVVVALDRRAAVFPAFHEERPLLDDRLTFFSPDGEVLRHVSLMEALMRSPFAETVRRRVEKRIRAGLEALELARERYAAEIAANPELAEGLGTVGDVFHTNSIRRVDAALAEAIDGLEEGWFLLSLRELDALVALDVAGDEPIARWYLQGTWRGQHEAVPLATGRILLFDNHGARRAGAPGRARVLEVDPSSGDVLWTYAGVPPVGLMSPVGGSCQRLANGNTLVIESTRGRAVEVTPEGDVVWEFSSPHRAGEDEELVAFLPDVVRIDRAAVQAWLG